MPSLTNTNLFLQTITLVCFASLQAEACQVTDYLAIETPRESEVAELDALRLAYTDIVVSPGGTAVSFDGQNWFDLGEIRDIPADAALRDPTIREQFKYRYPLDFDLSLREEPFFDPGRLRNGPFFNALYFADENAARASLDDVLEPALSDRPFQVTRKRNVSCQFRAALAELAASGEDYRAVFRGAGGGFNWRVISGTSRLSTHSFGIAIDVNADIGKYWQWTGARQGAVPTYNNEIPQALVRTMERYGFIWGGKWHHFDGMHFEYRPELILYSRIVTNLDRD